MGVITRQQAINSRKSEYLRLIVESNQTNKAMKKEASRFLAAITTLLQSFDFGDKDRWERLRMLRAVARLHYQIKNIQDYILSPKPMDSVRLLQETLSFSDNIQNDVFNKLSSRIDPMIEQLRDQVQKAEAALKISPESTEKKEPAAEVLDFNVIEMSNQLSDILRRILLSVQGLEESINLSSGRKRQVTEYVALFKRIHDLFMNAVNNNKPRQAKQWYEKFFNAHEMFEALRIQIEKELEESGLEARPSAEIDVKKEAGISHWMLRMQTKMFGGESKSLRLSADDAADSVRATLKKLMKELELRNASILDIADTLENLAPALEEMFKKIGKVLHNYQSKAILMEAESKSKGQRVYVPKLTYEMRNNISKASRQINSFTAKFREFSLLKDRLQKIEKEVENAQG